MTIDKRYNITIFYCINSFREPSGDLYMNCDIRYIKMPCSSMTKDVYILRAFEAGADAVLIFTCPEDLCRHSEGVKRAKKRVEWTSNILDQVGMDGDKQLALYDMVFGNGKELEEIIAKTLESLEGKKKIPANQF